MHAHSGCDICDLIQTLAELSAVSGLGEVVPREIWCLQLSAPHTLFISLSLFVSLSLFHLSCSLNRLTHSLLLPLRLSPAIAHSCIESGSLGEKRNALLCFYINKLLFHTHIYAINTHTVWIRVKPIKIWNIFNFWVGLGSDGHIYLGFGSKLVNYLNLLRPESDKSFISTISVHDIKK